MLTPAASASFSGTLTPPAGIYSIRFWYALSGTAETTLNNVRFKANNLNFITTMPSTSGAGWIPGWIERITLDGTHGINLAAGALATTGAVYSGIVIATRIG